MWYAAVLALVVPRVVIAAAVVVAAIYRSYLALSSNAGMVVAPPRPQQFVLRAPGPIVVSGGGGQGVRV